MKYYFHIWFYLSMKVYCCAVFVYFQWIHWNWLSQKGLICFYEYMMVLKIVMICRMFLSYLGLGKWNCDLEEISISLRYLACNLRWKLSVTIRKLSFWCLIWYRQACWFVQTKDEVMKIEFLHWQIFKCKLLLFERWSCFYIESQKGIFSFWLLTVLYFKVFS